MLPTRRLNLQEMSPLHARRSRIHDITCHCDGAHDLLKCVVGMQNKISDRIWRNDYQNMNFLPVLRNRESQSWLAGIF